jgi:hypothetical protein
MDYLTSLRSVTETIIAVIEKAVHDSLIRPLTFKVSPELLKDLHTGLGFYLFHVQESSHYRNFPAQGNDHPPVNYTPMALNLFYQLSANSTNDDSEEDAYDEQDLMSVAMKALHDHSIINLTASGKKVNIKITLQTLTPSESVQYWAAAQSPVRLSAYYEVSVVFLTPEKSKSYAGRVLTYGTYIFVQGTPKITASQSILEYKLPRALTPSQVKIQPAESPINNVVSFLGTGFNGGLLKLLLISPLWDKPAEADAAWLVNRISENQIDMTVQNTAMLQGTATVVYIIPGLYAARISIIEQRTLPNGSIKEFNHLSNQFPFSVMPSVNTITPLGLPSTTFTITGHLFKDSDIKNDDVQVYVGAIPLSLTSTVVPEVGRFFIQDKNTMKINVPASVHGSDIPLRIMVRGIESAPNWIIIP